MALSISIQASCMLSGISAVLAKSCLLRTFRAKVASNFNLTLYPGRPASILREQLDFSHWILNQIRTHGVANAPYLACVFPVRFLLIIFPILWTMWKKKKGFLLMAANHVICEIILWLSLYCKHTEEESLFLQFYSHWAHNAPCAQHPVDLWCVGVNETQSKYITSVFYLWLSGVTKSLKNQNLLKTQIRVNGKGWGIHTYIYTHIF